jgi:MerR family regulatory protein
MLVQDQPRLIGSVAKESGIPIKTIRYYEELGPCSPIPVRTQPILGCLVAVSS